MWWEPGDEHESRVRTDVERLSSWFRDQHKEGSALAWGVGSVRIREQGALFPFVVFNAFRIDGSWKRFVKAASPDPEFPIFPASQVPIGMEEGSGLPQTSLPVFGTFAFRPVAADTRLERARRFIADQIAVRDYVICRNTGALGTAAVRVFDPQAGSIGLLTAGHTFPDGVGTLVQRRRWRGFGFLSPRSPFGRISHHVMPSPGREDWDVAIISCPTGLDRAARTVTHCRSHLVGDESVFAQGARSGFMSDATIVRAALRSHGDEFRTWKNCWLMGPGGVLRPGDSGTAIFSTVDHALLGFYVGSSRTALGRASFHYVQDASSIQQHLLSSWGYDYC